MVFILLSFTLVFFALLEVQGIIEIIGFSRFADDSCEHTMPPASVYRFHDALEI